MRRPTSGELGRLARAARQRLKLLTIAPELPGALEAIRWCLRHGIAASLGHSVASAADAQRAVDAGARAVTHVFNGMPPMHHRRASLLEVALTDGRLTTMVIADGVHVGAEALRLLLQVKRPERIALVTDSIRRQGWPVTLRGGAYYLKDGTLAGSALTMIRAVRNAVALGGVSLLDAVRMASEVPARLLGDRTRGALAVGKRADLVAFDKQFRVLLTMVAGRVVDQRKEN
jgi:N-acetylglucosamine-6-phosphate deacetylase